jgi:hypothetical protein
MFLAYLVCSTLMETNMPNTLLEPSLALTVCKRFVSQTFSDSLVVGEETIPLQSLGVVDVAASGVNENEVLAHALANVSGTDTELQSRSAVARSLALFEHS